MNVLKAYLTAIGVSFGAIGIIAVGGPVGMFIVIGFFIFWAYSIS